MIKTDKGDMCLRGDLADLLADLVVIADAFKGVLIRQGFESKAAEKMIRTTITIGLTPSKQRNELFEALTDEILELLGQCKEGEI